MNFKKGSPGCPCDCDAPSCLDGCFFPCANGLLPSDCSVCGIDIQMPVPDETGIDPLLLPPDQCPEDAPCWACYRQLDNRFTLGQFGCTSYSAITPIENTCEDWVAYFAYRAFDTGGSLIVDGTAYGVNWANCWRANDYACPYDSAEDTESCPSSNIGIGSSWSDPGGDESPNYLLILSGNEWDGSCGKITLQIKYTVVELEAGFGELPIDGGEGCDHPKWTEYTHTFELEYCDCAELFDPFTYVSTTSVDSCAGSVPDPCNTEEAVVTLYSGYAESSGPEESLERIGCCACDCFNCTGFRNDKYVLTVSGPVENFTAIGTVGNNALFETVPCRVEFGSIINSCYLLGEVIVRVLCLSCDKFTAELVLYGINGSEFYRAETDVFDCGDSPVFTTVSRPGGWECDLSDHTFQLSFLPN